jgi:hypothetical protein
MPLLASAQTYTLNNFMEDGFHKYFLSFLINKIKNSLMTKQDIHSFKMLKAVISHQVIMQESNKDPGFVGTDRR